MNRREEPQTRLCDLSGSILSTSSELLSNHLLLLRLHESGGTESKMGCKRKTQAVLDMLLPKSINTTKCTFCRKYRTSLDASGINSTSALFTRHFVSPSHRQNFRRKRGKVREAFTLIVESYFLDGGDRAKKKTSRRWRAETRARQ